MFELKDSSEVLTQQWIYAGMHAVRDFPVVNSVVAAWGPTVLKLQLKTSHGLSTPGPTERNIRLRIDLGTTGVAETIMQTVTQEHFHLRCYLPCNVRPRFAPAFAQTWGTHTTSQMEGSETCQSQKCVCVREREGGREHCNSGSLANCELLHPQE